jgi:transcription termination factor Rho
MNSTDSPVSSEMAIHTDDISTTPQTSSEASSVVPEATPISTVCAESVQLTAYDGSGSNGEAHSERPSSPPPEAPFPVEISLNSLHEMSLAEITQLAASVNYKINAARTKHQLIYDVLSWMADHRTRVLVDGILEIGIENFGLIRYPKYSFAALPEDVFIPLFLVRKFGLRPGNRIAGIARAPKDKDKYLAIDRITQVDGIDVDGYQPPTHFEKLTATFPKQRIILEMPKAICPVSARIMDLIAPLGKGQRGLINASPRSGKTMMLKDIAKCIVHNHKEITLIILLLDERPEEVTDFEESVFGCEIYSSTFDESPKRHCQLAELVRERACRLVEMGKDVVILLDSLTRLARGYNSLMGGKGRTMSGGIDSKALVKPKKFFGAARNVEEGGSLTIIASALIDTESKMDEIIFEEFKGTGNMEATLDREISERRIFPAIHMLKSGTRKDDLLYHPEEFRRIMAIRRQLAQVPAVEALELLIRNINRTSNNAELLLTGLK